MPLSGHLPPPQSKPLSRGVGGQAETSVFRARKGTPNRVEHPSVNGRISFRCVITPTESPFPQKPNNTKPYVALLSTAGLFRDISHGQARHDIPAESKQ